MSAMKWACQEPEQIYVHELQQNDRDHRRCILNELESLIRRVNQRRRMRNLRVEQSDWKTLWKREVTFFFIIFILMICVQHKSVSKCTIISLLVTEEMIFPTLIPFLRTPVNSIPFFVTVVNYDMINEWFPKFNFIQQSQWVTVFVTHTSHWSRLLQRCHFTSLKVGWSNWRPDTPW